jgi:hypothetical protein
MRAKVAAKAAEHGSGKSGLVATAEEVAAGAAATEKELKRKRKEDKAAEKAAREEVRRAYETTKLRKLGIGKAKLTSEDAALMTEKEVARVELKHKRKQAGVYTCSLFGSTQALPMG